MKPSVLFLGSFCSSINMRATAVRSEDLHTHLNCFILEKVPRGIRSVQYDDYFSAFSGGPSSGLEEKRSISVFHNPFFSSSVCCMFPAKEEVVYFCNNFYMVI